MALVSTAASAMVRGRPDIVVVVMMLPLIQLSPVSKKRQSRLGEMNVKVWSRPASSQGFGGTNLYPDPRTATKYLGLRGLGSKCRRRRTMKLSTVRVLYVPPSFHTSSSNSS